MALRSWVCTVPRPRYTATLSAAAGPLPPAEWESAKPFQEIPGPHPLPLLGNNWRFIPWIGTYSRLGRLETQRRLRNEFGNLVRISNVDGGNALWVFDPSFTEMVYRNEGPWPYREGFQPLNHYRKVLRKERFNSLAGTLPSQGCEWQSFRSTVNQLLMQPTSAKQYLGLISEVAGDFVERIHKLRDENDELPNNFINEIYKWSLESIALVTLGTRLGCLVPNLSQDSEQQRMIDAILVAMDEIFFLENSYSPWKRIMTPALRRFTKAMDEFSDLTEKYIGESLSRRSPGDSESSILQELTNRDPAVASVMAMDLLLGGVDTTSHTIAALMFHLAKHSHVQCHVAEEARRALPSEQSPVTAQALDAMPYLKACFRESLRLFPIIPENSRIIPNDVVIEGFQIPAGTAVLLCSGAMALAEERFPEAARFVPGRWLREHPLHAAHHPFAALPFGFGPRACVGRRLAELQVLALAARICRQFTIEFHHGDELLHEEKAINFITTPLRFKLLTL